MEVPITLNLQSSFQLEVLQDRNTADDVGKSSKQNLESITSGSCGNCNSRVTSEVSQQKRKKRSTAAYTVQTIISVWINFNFGSLFINGVFQETQGEI